MTDRLTPEREAEIVARAAAATKGPWGSHRNLNGAYTIQARPRTTRYGMESDGDIATLAADRTDAESYANARFIAHARADVPALLAEVKHLRGQQALDDAEYEKATAELATTRARVAELERAAVEARAALGSLCYDLEDPGTAALGALHLLAQATTWTETGPDFAADALAQHDAKVLHEVADMADPEPPEVSFFGDHGPEVAAWLRRRANYMTRATSPALKETR